MQPVGCALLTRPRSARFELVGPLEGRSDHWFLTYTFPSRLPDPGRLAVPTRPVVVGAAPALPGVSRDQAALSFTGPLRQTRRRVLSPPLGP